MKDLVLKDNANGKEALRLWVSSAESSRAQLDFYTEAQQPTYTPGGGSVSKAEAKKIAAWLLAFAEGGGK